MPYYNFYGEFGSDDAEESEDARTRGDGFHYETINASFSDTIVKGVAKLMLEMVRAVGVDEMRVRYDGGSDEGFAHAYNVQINGQPTTLDVLIDLLDDHDTLVKIADAASADGSYWHDAVNHYTEHIQRRVAISDALDELAHEIASQLLGKGYGTGEYELYGVLTVNFKTGVMADDPAAEKPSEGF